MKKLLFLCNVFLVFFKPISESDLKTKEINVFKYLEFSEKNLYDYICFIGFEDPIFIFKQSIHETGWWKSNLYKKTNNLFGLHHPTKRKTTADYYILADHGKYCSYSHWTQSVEDLSLYTNSIQKRYPNIEYQQAIQLAGYCPDINYVVYVNKINYNFKWIDIKL